MEDICIFMGTSVLSWWKLNTFEYSWESWDFFMLPPKEGHGASISFLELI